MWCSGTGTQTASVDPNSAFAQILSLDSGDLINSEQDIDAAQEGCQIDVRVETNGISSGASFAVCTTALQGPADANCLGLPSALNGDCRILGAGSVPGSSVFECPISLSDSAHELSFVAVEGERVQSAIVSLNADCSPPQAVSVTIPEDVDSNGCINSRERLQPDNAAGVGEFTVQVQTQVSTKAPA